MKGIFLLVSLCSAVAVLAVGILVVAPIVFAGRVGPLTTVAGVSLGGIRQSDIAGAVEQIAQRLGQERIPFRLRQQEQLLSIAALGAHIDSLPTAAAVATAQKRPLSFLRPLSIRPAVTVPVDSLREAIDTNLASQLQLPKNASLMLNTQNTFTLVPSAPGEGVDWKLAQEQVQRSLARWPNREVIVLRVVVSDPEIQDNEVEFARQVASQLLREGIELQEGEQTMVIKPATLRPLITFGQQAEAGNPDNRILGVQLEAEALANYLTTTVEPDIDTPAQNARFELADGKVQQFALPQNGRQLDVAASVAAVAEALRQGNRRVSLAIRPIEPEISELAHMESLGLTALLAHGETDFAGSPKNRIHNITVGASRYHGLLLPPDTEFSFNSFLGPVDGEHGFKPELVIKNHLTIPEFGGGLCQVSTTAFRAAVESGLKITARRNHAYAVRYYGVPGFDATIYPPYTDLRFLNNTPGYILIQTKITGTKLAFDFWGTSDGRQVTIDGPTPYQRQSNGAVKATLKQKVAKDGQVVFEDTFYSNYKSPELFPHAVVSNGTPPAPAGT